MIRYCNCGARLGPNNQSGVCATCRRTCVCGKRKEPNVDLCAACKSATCIDCGKALGPHLRLEPRCVECRAYVPCGNCGKPRRRYANGCKHCRKAEVEARRTNPDPPIPSLGRMSTCNKCGEPKPTGAPCKPCQRAYMNEYNRRNPTPICKTCGNKKYRGKKCETCFPSHAREYTKNRRERLRAQLGKYVADRPLCKGCGVKPVPNAKRSYCDDCKPNRGPKPTDKQVPCQNCDTLRKIGDKCVPCAKARIRSKRYVRLRTSSALYRASARLAARARSTDKRDTATLVCSSAGSSNTAITR